MVNHLIVYTKLYIVGRIEREIKRGKMSKCIYCKTQLEEGSVLDVCERCGVGVWGHKMFLAIKQNMEGAKASGDLNQGSVTMGPDKKIGKSNPTQFGGGKNFSLVSEALTQLDSTEKDDIRYDSYNKKSA